MTIREAIQRIVAPMLKKQVRTGTAKTIDKDKCTCEVDLGNGASLYNVRFKSVDSKDDAGFVIVPKDGSVVSAVMIEDIDTNWELLHYSDIESFSVFTGGAKIELLTVEKKLMLNGKSCGDMVVIDKVVDRLNKIEDSINDLKHGMKSALTTTAAEPGQGASSVFQTTMNGFLASWDGQDLEKTKTSDINNEKVQHGNGS